MYFILLFTLNYRGARCEGESRAARPKIFWRGVDGGEDLLPCPLSYEEREESWAGISRGARQQ
jgi:hypothetical protein